MDAKVVVAGAAEVRWQCGEVWSEHVEQLVAGIITAAPDLFNTY